MPGCVIPKVSTSELHAASYLQALQGSSSSHWDAHRLASRLILELQLLESLTYMASGACKRQCFLETTIIHLA